MKLKNISLDFYIKGDIKYTNQYDFMKFVRNEDWSMRYKNDGLQHIVSSEAINSFTKMS